MEPASPRSVSWEWRARVGLWSGLSGPKVAGVQLYDAVSNTLAAPNFMATFQLVFENPLGSASPGSTAYSSSLGLGRIAIDYQAPDRAVMSTTDPAVQNETGHRHADRFVVLGSDSPVSALGTPCSQGVCG